jgi:hypothetical protein
MKLSGREAGALLAPVALLAGLGWLLRDRKPAVVTFQKPGPFVAFIKRVQILPARPVDVFDGYDTRVLVEFGAKGQKPAWWIKGFGGYSSRNAGQLVRVKNGELRSLGRQPYRDTPHLDSQTQTWKAQYLLKLADIAPRVGQIRLRDKMEFRGLTTGSSLMKTIWLDAPVRAANTRTPIPRVSHAPGLILKGFSFESAASPRAQGQSGGGGWKGGWRARWVFHKNGTPAEIAKSTSGLSFRVNIVNAHSETLAASRSSQFLGEGNSEEGRASSKPLKPDPHREIIIDNYGPTAPPAPHEPLWLRGQVRCNDAWPLIIKIPIRDATGKMLFTPRNTPAPFRVLSVSLVAPSVHEKNDLGADSTVSVKVQAVPPAADPAKWKWEADFSQHLRDAQGKLLWKMPFKNGQSSISPSYIWNANQAEVRYPLVLNLVPASAGKLVFEAQIAVNGSRRVPVKVVVRN